MIEQNPDREFPQVDKTSFIHSSAIIIGDVSIGKQVFIGPGAVLRADEPGSSIIIKDRCNVQDRVIIHAFENSSVLVAEGTSLTHGCIIHGPCSIGRDCFIGFGSVVLKSEIGSGVIVNHLCCIENVTIPSGMAVKSKALIKEDAGVKKLEVAGTEMKKLAENVIKTNLELTKKYKKMSEKS